MAQSSRAVINHTVINRGNVRRTMPTMRPVCVDSSSGLAEYRLASSVVASGMAAAWVGLVRCGLIPVRSLAAILSDCGCDSRALHQQAFCALTASPGARAYYDQLRGRGQGHHAALRQLSNRLVGILHGRLKTGTVYDEQTAWGDHHHDQQAAAAAHRPRCEEARAAAPEVSRSDDSSLGRRPVPSPAERGHPRL
jgi:hypothetical protein